MQEVCEVRGSLLLRYVDLHPDEQLRLASENLLGPQFPYGTDERLRLVQCVPNFIMCTNQSPGHFVQLQILIQ
jgi:hypothetical protein